MSAFATKTRTAATQVVLTKSGTHFSLVCFQRAKKCEVRNGSTKKRKKQSKKKKKINSL